MRAVGVLLVAAVAAVAAAAAKQRGGGGRSDNTNFRDWMAGWLAGRRNNGRDVIEREGQDRSESLEWFSNWWSWSPSGRDSGRPDSRPRSDSWSVGTFMATRGRGGAGIWTTGGRGSAGSWATGGRGGAGSWATGGRGGAGSWATRGRGGAGIWTTGGRGSAGSWATGGRGGAGSWATGGRGGAGSWTTGGRWGAGSWTTGGRGGTATWANAGRGGYPYGGAGSWATGGRWGDAFGGAGGGGGGGGGRGGGGGGNGGKDSWSWSASVGQRPHVPRLDHDAPVNQFPNHDHRGDTISVAQTYHTLCRGRHYTTRRYNASVWVTTSVVNGSSMAALRRIKSYFTGKNDQGMALAMIKPLRITVFNSNGTISDTEETTESFNISALVPSQFQMNLPVPLDTMLSIATEPARVFYSTHFRRPHRRGSQAIYDEYFELQDTIETVREPFLRGIFHTAFYDMWSDVILGSDHIPRRGEIMIPADSGNDDPMCMTETSNQEPQNGIRQCGKFKCPEYQHLDQLRDDIELRLVRNASYVTRTSSACSMILSILKAHYSLRRYLAGANTASQTFPTSAPFIHYVYPTVKEYVPCEQTVTSAFVLPPNEEAAEPTEVGVRIRKMSDQEMFVMKFGGRPTPRIVQQKVNELKSYLTQEGHCFYPNRYVLAVYDHPFNRPPHLNEVMVIRKPNGCHGDSTDDEEHTVRPTELPSTGEAITESRQTEGGTEEIPQASSQVVTEYPSLAIPLETSNNEVGTMDTDLIPYRFDGNEIDFPVDFPTEMFVY